MDNTDENVKNCYFYILSFPEQKKKTEGSCISEIIIMVICFSSNFKVLF